MEDKSEEFNIPMKDIDSNSYPEDILLPAVSNNTPEGVHSFLEDLASGNLINSENNSNKLNNRESKETKEEKQKLTLRPVKSEEEIREKVFAQLTDEMRNLSREDIEQLRLKLKNRPIIDSVILRDTLVGVDQNSTFAWVSTDKIVGMSFKTYDGWAWEIAERRGRIADVGREIIESTDNPSNLEEVFHPSRNYERIKLTAINGPKGPMFYVNDGTHRVSACMAIGLSEIPADVKEIKYPLEEIAVNESEVRDWQTKIDLGLIDGELQEVEINGRKVTKIVVRDEVLPWIRTTSQSSLIAISRVYEQLYPGSLDNLKIPRAALLDPIANNYYMAGRWEEWEEKFGDQPLDLE